MSMELSLGLRHVGPVLDQLEKEAKAWGSRAECFGVNHAIMLAPGISP